MSSESENEVDWRGIDRAFGVTELQKRSLQCLTDLPEPTWQVVSYVGDQPVEVVEAALQDLEAKKLVSSEWEGSSQPHNYDPERWWALTDRAWELLGLPKPGNYDSIGGM